MRVPVWIAAVVLAVSLLLPVWAGALTSGIDGERLRSNILALDRIRSGVISRSDQQNSPLGREERLFLDFLKGRIREDCGQLRRQGISVDSLPCPSPGPVLPTGYARSSAEQVAALDSKLQGLLGDFDEMLLTEQERVARQRHAAGGGGAAAARAGHGEAGQGEGGRGEAHRAATAAASKRGGRQAETRAGTQAGAGRQQDERRAEAAATGQGRQGSALKNGSPRGGDRLRADDDIVARQLREAAEKEQDPELKEKLWQEYRKYKEGR